MHVCMCVVRVKNRSETRFIQGQDVPIGIGELEHQRKIQLRIQKLGRFGRELLSEIRVPPNKLISWGTSKTTRE